MAKKKKGPSRAERDRNVAHNMKNVEEIMHHNAKVKDDRAAEVSDLIDDAAKYVHEGIRPGIDDGAMRHKPEDIVGSYIRQTGGPYAAAQTERLGVTEHRSRARRGTKKHISIPSGIVFKKG